MVVCHRNRTLRFQNEVFLQGRQEKEMPENKNVQTNSRQPENLLKFRKAWNTQSHSDMNFIVKILTLHQHLLLALISAC